MSVERLIMLLVALVAFVVVIWAVVQLVEPANR